MSSFRHHSSASHDADEGLSNRHDLALPPEVLAALAPRVISARHVRDSALTQLHEAQAHEGRRFALHVIAPQLTHLAGDAATLATKLRELPTLPGLTIPAIEWITVSEGVVCYATAWHDGVPVSSTDRTKAPSPASIASAGRELCRELGALHHRGLTHGMIVPEALTFDPDERRLVLEGTGVMTALHLCGVTPAAVFEACGTRTYAAPELFDEPSLVDTRADIFGLGGSLYELLTGCPPFGGRTTATVMATVLLDPRTTESASPISAAITDVIVRCLEKDPADRWNDFGALGEALASAVRGDYRPMQRSATRPSYLSRTAAQLKAALLGRGRRG